MMVIFFVSFTAVCLVIAEAARRVDLDLHLSRRSLKGPLKHPKSLTTLGPGEDLKAVTKLRTVPGKAKVKMQETYKGLDVVGETLVVEVDDRGHMTGDVSGRLVEGVADDIPSTAPHLSPMEALEVALKFTGDQPGDVMFDPQKDAKLQVQVKNSESVNVKAHLVYHLSYKIEVPHRISRPTFIIDAKTGKIVKQWEGLSLASWKKKKRSHVTETPLYKLVEGVGGNNKSGKHLYGLDLPELRVTELPNGLCSLQNQYALVYNCNSSYNCYTPNMTTHEFDCQKGFNDSVNDGYSPLNDAFFYVGITYEMYAEWYGASDPLHTADTNGGRCVARIHFGEAFENAFWDGEYITFGDGADMMYPLTSVNVVAHEISHGVTEKNSGLIYSGESGGMNEAFSDMAGEAAEEFLRHKIDWMVGYDIWKKANESMRYFDDPEKDGRSIGIYSDYCFIMNPHFSSGLYNRAFYILSNMPGWCVRQAFHVFFLANDLYWRPDSNFHDGACDVKRAAVDLGLNEKDVVDAFMQVGIEPCNKPTAGSAGITTLENGTTVNYTLKGKYENPFLEYSEMIIVISTSDRVEINLRTSTLDYSVKPAGNFSYQPVELHIKSRDCRDEPCHLEVRALEEEPVQLVVVPLAHVLTLIGGGNLESENDTLDLEFEIPKPILDHGLKVVIMGSSTVGGFMFFIRHEIPPNVESYEYDAVGYRDYPAILCKVRPGKYYIEAKVWEGSAENIDIHLYAVLTTEKVGGSYHDDDETGSGT